MGPTAFRDGIFSATDPMSQYGKLMTSYSDGSLGRSPFVRRRRRGTSGLGASMAVVGSCQRWCVDVNNQRGTPGRIKACNRMCTRFPTRWTKRLANQYRQNLQAGMPATRPIPPSMRKKATSGLGEFDSTTVTAAAIGVVLVGGLLWVGSSKKRRR